MSFPRAPPSLLQKEPTEFPGRAAPRGPISDPETRDKRQKAVNVLHTWELQAMHALDTGESIAEVKLRMMKAIVDTTSQKPNPGASVSAGSSNTR